MDVYLHMIFRNIQSIYVPTKSGWLGCTRQTIAGPSNQRQGAQTLFWFHKVQWNLKTSSVEIPGVDLDPKLVYIWIRSK